MIFEKMRNVSSTLVDHIHQQPFNKELAQGILPKEKFIFYLLQDALYLADFSRVLALTAARLPLHHHAYQFIEFALEAIKGEKQLHHHFLKKYNIQQAIITQQSPACFMYTNYLFRLASVASVEEAVASLLPCFWVYQEVSSKMQNNAHGIHHPYYDWIALYSSHEFAQSVTAAITITNDLGAKTSDQIQESMISAFVCATKLEWLFWESAYKQEGWLI